MKFMCKLFIFLHSGLFVGFMFAANSSKGHYPHYSNTARNTNKILNRFIVKSLMLMINRFYRTVIKNLFVTV